MKKDNAMKRGDIDFQYADNIVAVKQYDSHGVTLVRTCLKDCNQISPVILNVKGKSTKILVPRPSNLNEYNNGIGVVDLFDQRTAPYKFDRKSSSGRYQLRSFFSCCLQSSLYQRHGNARF